MLKLLVPAKISHAAALVHLPMVDVVAPAVALGVLVPGVVAPGVLAPGVTADPAAVVTSVDVV